jgi:UDPglucose 6-dehydrogenase
MKNGKRILVVGGGFVGLATATFLADRGLNVTIAEKNPHTVESLQRGELHFHEPTLRDHFENCVANGTVTVKRPARNLYEEAEMIVVAIDSVDASDWSMREDVFARMADNIGTKKRRRPAMVILKSTNVLGFSQMFRDLLDATPHGREVGLAVNPEFLREGFAYEDTAQPWRVVIGSDDKQTGKQLSRFYRNIYDSQVPVVVTDAKAAELIKLASNLYLSHRLAFVHEVAACARQSDLDVEAILKAVSLDPRIGGQYFEPGLGFGGSCLPKDCHLANSRQMGSHFRFRTAETALQVNEDFLNQVIGDIKTSLGSVKGRKIALLGAAFKQETDDTRGSRAVELARRLRRRGAQVAVHEPYLKNVSRIVDGNLPLEGDLDNCLRGAHMIVIGSPHARFRKIQPKLAASLVRRKLVCDCFRLLNRSTWEKNGFRFI